MLSGFWLNLHTERVSWLLKESLKRIDTINKVSLIKKLGEQVERQGYSYEN